MCVFMGVFPPKHHRPTTSTVTPLHLLLCLAERLTGCLSTRLTCLHGPGPPPALWLPPIDLFQETLEAGWPEIKEEGARVRRKEGSFYRGSLWRSHFFSFCGFCTSLECVETLRKVETLIISIETAASNQKIKNG